MPGGQEAIPEQSFATDHAQHQTDVPATTHHHKRRQYAAGQTQAYQGTAETVPQYADHAAPIQPAGGQLFTPAAGFSSEDGLQQPQQTPYFAPPEAQYGQPAAMMPPYQQQAAQLGEQFGQMNLAASGQKPVRLFFST
jgi:protein transport protein SEC24